MRTDPQRGRPPVWLLGLVVFQIACTLFFVSEFLTEVLGLRRWALPFAWREILQVLASLGLIIGGITSVLLWRNMSRRLRRAEIGLQAASGTFLDLMEREFDGWGLSATEREVALFALRGYDNAGIAHARGKSEATIKTQLNAVFRKAGVTGRAQLMSHFVDALIAKAPATEHGQGTAA